MAKQQNTERELAVFALALRLGRKDVRDLPKVYELDKEGLIKASGMIDNRYFVEAAKVIEEAGRTGVQVLSSLSPDYPSSLVTIEGAPELIFIRGSLAQSNDFPTIAIVGSRRPTREGRDFAEDLAYQITENGGIVVSGLAYGCDAAAHRGAIQACKDNSLSQAGVAVLGSGVINIYPSEHEQLADDLLKNGGAIISEFGLNSTPHKGCFPARNRIISGLAKVVVVIEAGEKSGSLITARFAAEQSRELFAVPGSPYSLTSKGCNQLIKDGAIPITDFSDLKEFFPELTKIKAKKVFDDPILKVLSEEIAMELEQLCNRLSSSPAELLPKLVRYELEGVVISVDGKFHLRH